MLEDSGQGGLVIPAVWWRRAMKGLLIGAIALIAYLIFERYLRVVVAVLLLAGLITYLLQPIVTRVGNLGKGKHVHLLRVSAVLGIYLVLAGVVAIYGAVTAHTITMDQAALHDWLHARRHVIPEQARRLELWYETTIPADVRGQMKLNLQHEASLFPTKYWPKIADWFLHVTRMTGTIITVSIELILLPLLFAFYFLTDSANVREQVKVFVPERYHRVIAPYVEGMDRILRQYVRGQLLLGAIAWVWVTATLLIMHIPGALLLGLVAGISRGIPLIGPNCRLHSGAGRGVVEPAGRLLVDAGCVRHHPTDRGEIPDAAYPRRVVGDSPGTHHHLAADRLRSARAYSACSWHPLPWP